MRWSPFGTPLDPLTARAGRGEERVQERLQRTLMGFLVCAAGIVLIATTLPGILRPDAWVRIGITVVVVSCLVTVLVLRRVQLPARHFLPVAITLDAMAGIGSTMTASPTTAPFCIAALSSITILTAYQGSRRGLFVQMAIASGVLLWRGLASYDTAAEAVLYFLWSEFGLILPAYALYLLIGDLITSLRAADWFANHDVLTGLLNRHGLAQAAPALVADARSHERPLGAVMCDLDRFKRLNDTFGHAAGDDALRRFADVLRQEVGSAVAVRLGGEEFAVLRPGTAAELAALGERIRTAVHEAGQPWSLTVSVGVAVEDGRPAGDADALVWSLLAEADEAVYAAKAGGRDRVCVHRTLPRSRRVRPGRHVPETHRS